MSLILKDIRTYLSCDIISKSFFSVADEDLLYPLEFFNSLSFSGIPNYGLKLKVGIVIMLLRNINQMMGLCNGTRLIITRLAVYIIEASIITESNIGENVFIPKIKMISKDKKWPFVFTMKQFHVRLCYKMTINKSQGQKSNSIDLFLPRSTFTQGQLYVAFSKATSRKRLRY